MTYQAPCALGFCAHKYRTYYVLKALTLILGIE